MRVLNLSIVAVALTAAFAAPSIAQTQTPQKPQTTTPPPAQRPPAQPPATQPPATQPPATLPAASKPQAPVPFPQDAKYAVVDFQAIVQNSIAGKEESKKLNDLTTKKNAEIQDKTKQLQALQTKRESGGQVLSDSARAQLDRDIDKLQRDIQYANTSAQAEVTELNNELQAEFMKKVAPTIEEIAKEKGLYLVFTAESGFAYVHPGLNISDDVIKRLDAKKN